MNPIMTGEGPSIKSRLVMSFAGAAALTAVACTPIQNPGEQQIPVSAWTLKPTPTPNTPPTPVSQEVAEANRQKFLSQQQLIESIIDEGSPVEEGEFVLSGPTFINVEEGSNVAVTNAGQTYYLPAGINVIALNGTETYGVQVQTAEGKTTTFHNVQALVQAENVDQAVLGFIYKFSLERGGDKPWNIVYADAETGETTMLTDMFSGEDGAETTTPEEIASYLVSQFTSN